MSGFDPAQSYVITGYYRATNDPAKFSVYIDQWTHQLFEATSPQSDVWTYFESAPFQSSGQSTIFLGAYFWIIDGIPWSQIGKAGYANVTIKSVA